MIRIERLRLESAVGAASLFVDEFARLRQKFPMLAEDLQDAGVVGKKLERMGDRALVAIEDGRLVGYLAWWNIGSFRGSGRRGAYVPEWAHGALPGRRASIYRALYRVASAEWAASGVGVHAISLLANDEEAREVWFWNGFGLGVVDGVRSLAPLHPAPATSLDVRLATPADADALAELDAEHVRHYPAPPLFMAPPAADTPASFAEFMQRPKNSVWLALDRSTPAGFMRFSGYDFDAVAVLQSDAAAFCNAAYVRRGYRGRGAGAGMLQAAVRHYADLGLGGLFTNFESFNPEAASFWPRYFGLVCLSLMRVPEVLPAPAGPAQA